MNTYHIRIVYKSGRAVRTKFEASSLNDANNHWHNVCLGLDVLRGRWKDVDLSDNVLITMVELKEGRKRWAWNKFENGYRL